MQRTEGIALPHVSRGRSAQKTSGIGIACFARSRSWEKPNGRCERFRSGRATCRGETTSARNGDDGSGRGSGVVPHGAGWYKRKRGG